MAVRIHSVLIVFLFTVKVPLGPDGLAICQVPLGDLGRNDLAELPSPPGSSLSCLHVKHYTH